MIINDVLLIFSLSLYVNVNLYIESNVQTHFVYKKKKTHLGF